MRDPGNVGTMIEQQMPAGFLESSFQSKSADIYSEDSPIHAGQSFSYADLSS